MGRNDRENHDLGCAALERDLKGHGISLTDADRGELQRMTLDQIFMLSRLFDVAWSDAFRRGEAQPTRTEPHFKYCDSSTGPNPDLLAWMGEDELGNGVVGIKQAAVPAGIIPIVVTAAHRDRALSVAPQMQYQANTYRRPIALVRYRAFAIAAVVTPHDTKGSVTP